MKLMKRTKEGSESNEEDKMKIRTLRIFFIIERLKGQRRVDYQCRLDGGIAGGFVSLDTHVLGREDGLREVGGRVALGIPVVQRYRTCQRQSYPGDDTLAARLALRAGAVVQLAVYVAHTGARPQL